MELLARTIGPVGTNVYILADSRTHEAIAIDTAIPSVAWVSGELAERGWQLKLIVSTHGHWDHIGDNSAVQAWTHEHQSGDEARIAVHALDREMLLSPQPLFAPFPIPPSVPAVELAEGGRVRFGEIDLEVFHTPGHTEGSVCLLDRSTGLLLSGDTLFAGSWGRTDLPGGSDDQMAESLARLAGLEDALRVLPGHGPSTTIGRERPWLDWVRANGVLPR
jgi:glyoxylase-like metal-dependent hydrolase (beta-lactamase superfamily II)